MALVSSSEAFSRYLAEAVENVKETLEYGGVAILVPPGSARGEVVKRLIHEGVVSEDDVLLYEDLHRRLGIGRPFRRVGDQFYVGEQPLLDYLARGRSLRRALRRREVVIVPRDTSEALLVRKVLLEELEEEGKWYGIEYIDVAVEILFLPAYYQGEELAKVDYRRVLGGVTKEAIGFSPSLQLLTTVEPKLAQKTWKIFRALDPSRYFGEGLHPIIASRISGVLYPSTAQSEVRGVKELLVKLFFRLKLASVLKALRYVDDQRIEARVDEVVAKWGLTMEDFKALLHLIAGEVATREELERLKALEDKEFKKAIKELINKRWIRIVALKEEVEMARKEFREAIRLLNLSLGPVYISAEEWPYVEEAGGEVRLKRGLLGGGPLVYNSVIDKAAEALADAAKRGGGVVVVKGGKGVGKSTAAAAAVYRLLMGVVEVGERVYKPIAVEVKGVVDRGLLQNFVEAANDFGYLPVLYFDPSALPAYPERAGEEYKPEVSVDVVREVVAPLLDVVKRERRHAVVFVVSPSERYWEVEEEVLRRIESGAWMQAWVIDADGALMMKGDFVKDLVEKYSGCTGEVVERVADAVSSFKSGYAVVAVLAADWLRRRGCRGEEVEKAVVESWEKAWYRVDPFILHYLWYGLFNGDETMAERHAPLLLAVGFFGPHPPKLAKAVVRAFGREPEGAVVRWFSQLLHGTLYEAIWEVARSAVYRWLGVGDDWLCQGSVEGPCRLVEICSEALVGVPRKNSSVGEVAKEYAKVIAERLRTTGPAGVRQIDFLINDFLRIYKGVAEDGRWRIRYEAKGPQGLKTVEDVVDELDVLSALYGLAALPGWYPELKPLEEWFFVDGIKVGLIGLYLYPLLRERSGELVKKAVTIVHDVERRGFYTDVDVWRAVGIVATGQWDSATDEELEKAVKLVAVTLRPFATVLPTVLDYIKPLLSETERRIWSGETYGYGDKRQRLADWLSAVVNNVMIGYPQDLLRFFTEIRIIKKKPRSWR